MIKTLDVRPWIVPGLIRRFMPETKEPEPVLMTPVQICEIICKAHGVPWEKVSGGSRKREFVLPRQWIQWFLCYHSGLSLRAIGELVKPAKPLDHTTVIHSRDTINDLIETNPAMAAMGRRIEALITGKMDNLTAEDVTALETSNPINPEQNVRTTKGAAINC